MELQTQLNPEKQIKTNCPVCQSADFIKIIDLHQTPVLSNVLWDTREAALTAPRADIRLAFCNNCGHVFNQYYDPAELEYNLQYENSLHFSPRFQAYATWLANHLIDQYGLHQKQIIEIGSGKGEFLRMMCDLGENTGIGFDPSYEPQESDDHPSLTFIQDLYSEKYAGYQADLLLSRHVLEHIDQPAAFIQRLRRTLGSNKAAIVFFEVPNLAYILRDTAIWDIIYEHVSYFSPQSLIYLFSHADFNVLDSADAYQGQFLYIEASPREPNTPPNQPDHPPLSILRKQIEVFSRRSQEKLQHWQSRIANLHQSGERVVVWGAGSKGISFLNMLNIRDEIEYIVDINPRKHERFVTGAGQQIVPPNSFGVINLIQSF